MQDVFSSVCVGVAGCAIARHCGLCRSYHKASNALADITTDFSNMGPLTDRSGYGGGSQIKAENTRRSGSGTSAQLSTRRVDSHSSAPRSYECASPASIIFKSCLFAPQCTRGMWISFLGIVHSLSTRTTVTCHTMVS